MKKVIVIGSGPAGISASLYLKRSGKIDVTVISKGMGALEKAEKIENFYGFETAVTGAELHKRGVEGAKNLGIDFLEEQVVSLNFDENFKPVVETEKNKYISDAVLIATGVSRKSPNIKGLKEFEGKGISYCAVCDAFFYRNKDVAVLGNGEYALHEAMVLAQTSKSVTILSNGLAVNTEIPENINIIKKKITSINGENTVRSVTFDDGAVFETSGIFIALGVAGSTDLARKIGVEVSENKIVVNENMQTNIPFIFAAGDCTDGIMQVSKAVADGAKAGLAMINFLKT